LLVAGIRRETFSVVLHAAYLLLINPGIQILKVHEDALAASDMGEVPAPDHLSDRPVTHRKVPGRFGQRAQAAGEWRAWFLAI
jgi:hypothetical protein